METSISSHTRVTRTDAHAHTDRQTDRHRHTDRHRNRHKDTQTKVL